MQHFIALWSYRYFILSSIKNEFKTKFIRSKLGGLWIILHPLAQVAIYALVLSAVLSAKLPGIDSRYAYAIYLMAGILGWNLFSEILGRCVNIFLDNANLLKKMAFPKMTLPLILFGSSILNNILLFIAILVVFSLLGHYPNSAVIWLIPLTVLISALALGMGLVFGIMNVFLRDIGQIVPIILQFWFWLTPIVYSWTIIPEKYLYLVMLNPIGGIIKAYQDILVYGKAPVVSDLIYPACLSVVLVLMAFWMFIKANEEMTDVL